MQSTIHGLKTLQSRSINERAAMRRRVETADKFNLIDLINSRLQYPQSGFGQAAIDEAASLSESCRQYSGQAPDGIWIPLHVLAAGRRDLTTTTGSAMKAPAVAEDLGLGVVQDSAILGGATVLSGLVGSQVGLPRLSTGVDATGGAWIAEGSDAPQREPVFGNAVLTPKTLSIELTISRRLLMNSSVQLDAQIRAEIMRQFAAEIDRAAIAGAGNATEPQGIINNSDVEVVSAGTNGAAVAWEHPVELEYRVASRAGLNGLSAPSFVGNPILTKAMRKTARVSGGELMVLEDSGMLAGHRYANTAAVPSNLTKGTSNNCSALIFGDLAEVFVGFWGPTAVDFLVDGFTHSASGAVRLIARAEVGIAVRTPEVFAVYKDLQAA